MHAPSPRLLCAADAEGLVTVAKVEHPVSEEGSASSRLLHSTARVGKRNDDAGREVLVQFPVGIEVRFHRDVVVNHCWCYRLGLIEVKVIKDHASTDVRPGFNMRTNLMGDEIGIGKEVFAGDLTLPPGAPIVKAEEQRIECFVAGRRRIIALKKGIPIRQLRLP